MSVNSIPGVPPLLLEANTLANVLPVLLTADAEFLFSSNLPPVWGIYLNSVSVLDFDSLIGLQYKHEWKIADFPMEQGAFQSYNKVQVPFDLRISVVKGGSDADRLAFLGQVESMGASTELYDVITPEYQYTNVNVAHLDYSRVAERGKTLIRVDIWFAEVRVTAVSEYSNTVAPSGAATTQVGTLQPVSPTTGQQEAINSALALPAGFP